MGSTAGAAVIPSPGRPRHFEDWDDVLLAGRDVVIAFDGDVQRKDTVRSALDALTKFLVGRGAVVTFCWLPDTDEKTGLDDVSDGAFGR